MSTNAADIHRAVSTSWDDSGLDDLFKALWPDPAATEYPVLHDSEASPGQPFPYCVVEHDPLNVVARMSGGVASLREIRDVPLRFNVHAADVDGDERSAKEIADYLQEEIVKQFGGHPTTAAEQTLTLDEGTCLLVEYQNDVGVRTGDQEYSWIVSYILRVDVPVMA